MAFERVACVASGSDRAEEALQGLRRRYDFVPVEQAEVLVALGGDGFMLRCLHDFVDQKIPIYGMNRGTVGFLMNEFHHDDLLERINEANPAELHPLHMKAIDAAGEEHHGLAFNEVALTRQSYQAANIRVIIDGNERLDKLVGDGVLVSAPAGTTAYNLSVRGPIIPIGANVLALTPISPARPRRWGGALLPHTAVVEFINLDPPKRPLGTAADFYHVRDTVSVTVREDRSKFATVLFDSGHTLQERIIREQFSG
jgi:NAD+ kinase